MLNVGVLDARVLDIGEDVQGSSCFERLSVMCWTYSMYITECQYRSVWLLNQQPYHQ